MGEVGLFADRDELLGGAPGKRAESLLYLIERRTTQVALRAQRQLRRFGPDPTAEEDLTFFESFASTGGEGGQRPSVQQLERYASRWADLVPRNPRLQAALAHALAKRHAFTHAAVPGIRAALGLDEPAVRRSFERLYGQPLDSIYAERVQGLQRLRWAWAALARRLESLPPFWTVYALVLTETVGATIVALPIAFAGLGAVGGLVVLVVVGLVNTLTLAYMCEAVTRSGPMRYSGSYLGRLLHDLLSPSASAVISGVMVVLCLLLLPTYYIGVASTLAAATSVPAVVWVALLFAVNVFFLRRGLGATVAGALLVGGVNIAIVLALIAVTVPHLRADLLTAGQIPFVGGAGFDAAILGLVFGVTLAAFCGHTSAVLAGQLVLPRDPGGRALLHGGVAASLTAIALYALFVVTVNGAVPGDVLAAQDGTVLPPLADVVGPVVLLLGSVFVALALGMGSIHFSVALFSVVAERLPAEVAPTVTLARRSGRVVVRPRAWRQPDVAILLTYQGLVAGVPVVRCEVHAGGAARFEDLRLVGRWELTPSDPLWPEGADPRVVSRWSLALEVVEAGDDVVRLKLTTTMRVAEVAGGVSGGGGDVGGLLLDSSGELLAWLLREGPADAATVARGRDLPPDQAIALLDALVRDGKLVEQLVNGVPHYAARMIVRPRRASGVVDALADVAPPADHARGRHGRPSLGSRGRFLVAAAPVALAFAVTEWMVLTGSGTFAGLLGIIGVLVVPVLSGAAPVLLVVAARRRGFPAEARTARSPGGGVVQAAAYCVFVGSILLHGLVIWEGRLAQIGALAAAVAIMAYTAVVLRRARRRRLTLEVRGGAGASDRARYRLTMAGEPVSATVVVDGGGDRHEQSGGEGVLPDLDRIRHLVVNVPAGTGIDPDEVKVWVHRAGADGSSSGVAGVADIGAGRRRRRGRLRTLTGELLVPIDGPAGEIVIGIEPGGSAVPEAPG